MCFIHVEAWSCTDIMRGIITGNMFSNIVQQSVQQYFAAHNPAPVVLTPAPPLHLGAATPVQYAHYDNATLRLQTLTEVAMAQQLHMQQFPNTAASVIQLQRDLQCMLHPAPQLSATHPHHAPILPLNTPPSISHAQHMHVPPISPLPAATGSNNTTAQKRTQPLVKSLLPERNKKGDRRYSKQDLRDFLDNCTDLGSIVLYTEDSFVSIAEELRSCKQQAGGNNAKVRDLHTKVNEARQAKEELQQKWQKLEKNLGHSPEQLRDDLRKLKKAHTQDKRRHGRMIAKIERELDDLRSKANETVRAQSMRCGSGTRAPLSDAHRCIARSIPTAASRKSAQECVEAVLQPGRLLPENANKAKMASERTISRMQERGDVAAEIEHRKLLAECLGPIHVSTDSSPQLGMHVLCTQVTGVFPQKLDEPVAGDGLPRWQHEVRRFVTPVVQVCGCTFLPKYNKLIYDCLVSFSLTSKCKLGYRLFIYHT